MFVQNHAVTMSQGYSLTSAARITDLRHSLDAFARNAHADAQGTHPSEPLKVSLRTITRAEQLRVNHD